MSIRSLEPGRVNFYLDTNTKKLVVRLADEMYPNSLNVYSTIVRDALRLYDKALQVGQVDGEVTLSNLSGDVQKIISL